MVSAASITNADSPADGVVKTIGPDVKMSIVPPWNASTLATASRNDPAPSSTVVETS